MQEAFQLKATSSCILLSGTLIFLIKTLSHCSIIHIYSLSPTLTSTHPNTQATCFSRERFWFIPANRCWRPGASQGLKKKKTVKWLSSLVKWITILAFLHNFTSENERNKRDWGVRKLSGEETKVNTAGKCLELFCRPYLAGVSWPGSLDRSQKRKSVYAEWKLAVCSEPVA